MMNLFKRTARSGPSLLHSAASDPLLQDLGRELMRIDAGLGLFRLAHLVDAISRCPNPQPKKILSIGSGLGYHEAFLARLFPQASVVGADLRTPSANVKLPNLEYRRGNLLDSEFTSKLPRADFVYSIECLEHINEDRAVASTMASLVGPRGALYIQVPFASEAELANADLVRTEFELWEHVRPGYTADQLTDICRSNGFRVVCVAGAFWVPMQPIIWAASQRYGIEKLVPYWLEFLDVAQRDIREKLPLHREEATAIKVLGVRQ